MTKITIEIDDTLEDDVKSAIEEVKDLLLGYLDDNKEHWLEQDEPPCINNDLDYSGEVHEIIDGSVPIHTKDIDDIWYLYADLLEEAYNNAGFGKNPRENNGMVAIYCYIEQEVQDWYRDEAQDIFDEWKEKNKKETEDEEAIDEELQS